MSAKRRKCKLANTDKRDIDLKEYEQIIIDTINATVPNKNTKVFSEYFSTDILTQSEAVVIGRALAKVEALSVLGKPVTTLRLFEGKTYDSEDAKEPSRKKITPRGGRRR